MDHIPVEILNLIFLKLDLKDKLECMLVCQFWHDTLDRRSLLSDLRIYSRQYSKFKDMLERLPYRRTQVEYLTLHECFRPNFDKRELYNVFPNLQELRLIKYLSIYPKTNYTSNEFHFTHSASKLRYIEDFSECELTRQLAMSSLCNRLKSLTLDLMDSPGLSKSNVIPNLYNMPVLERLRLTNAKLNLMDLEMINSNIPSLKAVDFVYAQLVSGTIPRDVKPAALITELSLKTDEVEDLQTHIQFYKYMGNKYPSVNALNILDIILRDGLPEYVTEVYNDGVFPLYQKVGSQIDRFVFENYCNGLNAFKKFDDFGMKLIELVIKSHDDDVLFLEELVQSQQSKHIQKLKLGDILPLPLNRLNCMEALELLIISCRNLDTEKTINFSALIDACPNSLLSLATESIRFTFNDSASNLTSIKYLSLRQVELTPDLASAIATSFPQLLGLALWGFITNSLTISLPTHNLKEIDIITLYKEEQRNGFSVKTIDNGKHQFYTLKPNVTDDTSERVQAGDELVHVSEEEFNDPLILNIVCASVSKLSLSAFEEIKFEDEDDDEDDQEEDEDD